MNELKLAEEIDNFLLLTKYNECNSLVRKNHSYTPDFNDYMNTINNFIVQRNLDIKVIQLHPSAENGFPHTRPNNIVCIPSNLKFPSLEKTINHELVHIHQRNYLGEWTYFLHNEKWFEVNQELIPDRWKEKIRYNPDTIYSTFWAFENRYVPLPIFIKPHNPSFNEIKVMFYDLQTGVLEHEPPNSFIKKYGDNRQSEHVFEIYAVILEDKIKDLDDISRWMRK